MWRFGQQLELAEIRGLVKASGREKENWLQNGGEIENLFSTKTLKKSVLFVM